MKPGWVLGLGGSACAALLIISRIWLPHAETDAVAPALQHLAATGAVVVFYALLAAYIALSSEAAGSTGRIITVAWLGLAALLSTLALVGTYAGLSYRIFWTQVVVMALLLTIIRIAATQAQEASAARREGAAHIRAHRQTRIAQELAQFQAQIAASVGTTPQPLVRPLERLIDELRLFPAHADGASADQIERDLLQWSSHLIELPPSSLDEARQQQIVREALALQDRLASWRRT